jgi:hypothetical protein
MCPLLVIDGARKKPRRYEFLVDAEITTESILTSHKAARYSIMHG